MEGEVQAMVAEGGATGQSQFQIITDEVVMPILKKGSITKSKETKSTHF